MIMELTMSEEQRYEDIFTMLLMSGEYREQDIDTQVHEIMDNPHIYPEYFNWLITSTVRKVGITKPVMNTILAVKLVQC